MTGRSLNVQAFDLGTLRRLTSVVVPALVAALLVTGTARAEGPSDRLRAKVTLSVNALDLADFVALLRQKSGVPLVVDKGVVQERVTARLRDRSLKEVFDGLKGLFGYQLRYDRGTDTHFVTEGDHRRRVDALKQHEVEAFKDRARSLIQTVQRVPAARTSGGLFLRVVARTPLEAVDTLTERPFVLTYDQLSEEERGLLRAWLRMQWRLQYRDQVDAMLDESLSGAKVQLECLGQGASMNLAVMIVTKRDKGGIGVLESRSMKAYSQREGAVFGYHQWAALLDASGKPGRIDAAAGSPSDLPPNPRGAAGLPEVSAGDLDLRKPVSITIPRQKDPAGYVGDPDGPLSPSDEVYHSLARQASLDFLADSFAMNRVEAPFPAQSAPLGDTLDRLCTAMGSAWGKSGRLYIFRRDDWQDRVGFLVPASLVRKWLRFWTVRLDAVSRPVALWELAGIASMLTPTQAQALNAYQPPRLAYGLATNSGILALYRALPAKDQERMLSDQGVNLDDVPRAARRLLSDRLLPGQRRMGLDKTYETPGAKLRIRSGPRELAFDLGLGRGWISWASLGPPTAPGVPPPDNSAAIQHLLDEID
ncbi:MAG TPA: hypothetical protein VGN26_15000 [Armatimonadota bacterium]|jgi:hypothetical protein